MTQLPSLPTHRRTTTRYEPYSADIGAVAFRPKLPIISKSDKYNKIINNDNNEGGGVMVPRGALWQYCRHAASQQRMRLTDVPRHRSMQWLMYEEEQERSLIIAAFLSTSPVQCFFDHSEDRGSRNSHLVWKFTREGPLFTSEEELTKMIRNAFSYKIQENEEKIASLQCIEEEENYCRYHDVIKPCLNDYQKLKCLQDVYKEKCLVWNKCLHEMRIYRDMLNVIKEEKKHRLSLLGEFLSCETPLPCKHLLWDLEVLEESNHSLHLPPPPPPTLTLLHRSHHGGGGNSSPSLPIHKNDIFFFLEPEVNILCLFVAIVVKENNLLQESLLQKREEDLFLLQTQYEIYTAALQCIQKIRKKEQDRYELLLNYHTFCMKLSCEERTEDEGKAQEERENKMSHILKRKRSTEEREYRGVKHPWLHYYLEQLGSPSVPYFIYMHLLNSLGVEGAARQEIMKYEQVEFASLFCMCENFNRLLVLEEEKKMRRNVCFLEEEQERFMICSEEISSLERHIQPGTFFHQLHLFMQRLHEKHEMEKTATYIQNILHFLGEYERCRRGEILLLEKKMRVNNRYFFFTMYTKGGDQYVARRWMFQHAVELLRKEEEELRLHIEQEERDALVTRTTAHRWLVEYSHSMIHTLRQRTLQRAGDHFMMEQEKLRGDILSQCMHERYTLFEKKLCVPSCMHVPGREGGEHWELGRDEPGELDIRQVTISDLSEFLQDDVLFTLFDSST